ncbi:MAG: insulinase family protein [Myxococcota bacterium]
MRLVVTLPDAATDQVEPLYDVPYAIRPLTDEEKAAFTAGTELQMALPPSNPYLPQDTSLVEGDTAPVPTRLSDDGARLELWHLQDASFGVPRALAQIELWSADPRASTRDRVAVALLDRLLDDALQEFRYPLGQAGMDFSVSGTDRGLELRAWGYDDGLTRMLRDLSARIAAFEVDPARFEIQRARAVREWQNVAQDWPIDQARRAEYEAMYPYAFQREEAIRIAKAMRPRDLAAFADRLRDGLSARMLVHGNVTAAQAQEMAAAVQETLLAKGTPPAAPPVAVRTLPEGKQIVRDVAIDHTDSTLDVVYQGHGTDPVDHAKWMILGQLLDTPFFTQLRTEQQLGYTVQAYYTRFDRLPGLRMSIQSGVAGPVTLLQRVDAFLDGEIPAIEQMAPEEYTTLRSGIVARLREKDTQLYRRSDRLIESLDLGVPGFDWDEQVAQAVEGIDRDTIAAFAREVLAPDGPTRLIVRSFGTNHADEQQRAVRGCRDNACVASKLGQVWTREL